MAALDDIVNPVITLESSGITGVGFGTIMVASSLPAAVVALWGSDVVRSYTSANAMLAASEGFLVTDQAYKIVAALFAQTPKPSLVKVGKRALQQTQVVNFVPTKTTEGYIYHMSVQGRQVLYTVPNSATAATISTAIVALINELAADKVLAATVSSTGFKCTSDVGFVAEYTSLCDGLTVSDDTPDPGIATDLAAIDAADPNWYHLVVDSFSKAEITAAATWADSAGLLMFQAQTGDSAVTATLYSAGVTTDVASTLKAASRMRTAIWWNQDLAFTLAPGICGEEASRIPGSSIYRYKNLSGPVPSDQLTASQVANLQSKNCNYYQTLGNLGRTMSGKVAGSAYIYIDNVVFLDWWRNTCQVNLVGYLVSKPKISFTDAGIAGAVAQIELTNATGIANGGINPTPAPTVTAPLAAAVSPANKEARNLPDIAVTFTLAGAIETVNPITVSVRM